MMNQDQQKETTEQIWRELSDRLRRFVRSRIESPADVDDVLQTVFLRIHSKSNELRNADRLESWVFQITRNAVIDHFRNKRDTQNDVELLPEETNESEPETVNAQLTECLNTFIEKLPQDQRRALSMYELDGISQKVIAVRESISVSGAKSRIQRARKALEGMIKACCEFQFDGRGNVVECKAPALDCCEEECG